MKKTLQTVAHVTKGAFSNPMRALRAMIVLCGVAAAAAPVWELTTAVLTVLSSFVTILFVTALTAGAVWLTSNWRKVWKGVSEGAAGTINDLIGKEHS
jgi:hypothetical protein